jgi:hypothetical protein
MSKLENFGDLFKYSKELLEDDFNAGQSIVLKTKSKSQDGLTVRIALFIMTYFSFISR